MKKVKVDNLVITRNQSCNIVIKKKLINFIILDEKKKNLNKIINFK